MADTVEEIKQKLDIVDVVSEYIKLQRAGTSYRACCPFHKEKTPSFFVSQERQTFHCFGCDKGGDMFTFVQEMEGVEFVEAMQRLAQKAGVEVRKMNPEQQNKKTRTLEVLMWAARYYYHVLNTTQTGADALKYAREKRGLEDKTIEAWRVGFAPESWEALRKFLQKKGFKEEEMRAAGLTIQGKRGDYDRFRNRLMFPIMDHYGGIVGFTGRIMPGADSDMAKYLNSPETIVFNKSSVVFGLHAAKKAIREAGSALLVEGQMDCISAHQAGIENAVATSGTALTDKHISLIKRFSSTLVLAMDDDTAGHDAAKRAAELALAQDMTVRMMRIPEGKDPDDAIRANPGAFKLAVEQAPPFMDVLIQRACETFDVSTGMGKKDAAAQIVPFIRRIANPVERDHYIQQLSFKVRVDEGAIRDLVKAEKVVRPAPKKEKVTDELVKKVAGISAEESFMALLLYNATLVPEAEKYIKPEDLRAPPLQTLYKSVLILYNQHESIPEHELRSQDAGLSPLLDKYAVYAEAQGWNELGTDGHLAELQQLITRLRGESVRKQLQDVAHLLRQAEKRDDTKRVDELTVRFSSLTRSLRDIEE